MEKRWKVAMEQGTIGGMPLLMGMPCMLLVAERLMDSDIITISVLHFDVSLKCNLHLLNFEGTRCSKA
jgi:hypothetical protein